MDFGFRYEENEFNHGTYNSLGYSPLFVSLVVHVSTCL